MDTIKEIIDQYGEPVMRFKLSGEFTREQMDECGMPREVAVFRMPAHRIDEYIVFSRFPEDDNWTPNAGERWVIREMINLKVDLLNRKT